MKALLMTILTAALALAVGCDSARNDKEDRIKKPLPSDTRKMESIEKDLDSLGLEINENYQDITQSKPSGLLPACDAEFNEAFEKVTAKIAKFFKRLDRNEDKFTGDALTFYYRAQYVTASAKKINSMIKSYCENDHEKMLGCLPRDPESINGIYIFINRHVAGHLDVQPYFSYDDKDGYAVAITGNDIGDQARTYDLYDSEFLALGVSQTLAKDHKMETVRRVSNCAYRRRPKSEVGKRLQNAMGEAYETVLKHCDEWPGRTTKVCED